MQRVRLIFCLALVLSVSAFADTIVMGKIQHPITGSGVAGINLKVEYQGRVLASGRSGHDGRFRLSFAIEASPEARNVTLIAEHDGAEYTSESKILVITGGRPDSTFYEITLMPAELSGCLIEEDHLVIVGYFLPPIGGSNAEGADLSDRVRRALTTNLVTAIQLQNIPFDLQPLILTCSKVKPRSNQLLRRYAETLKADVFVSGTVQPADGAFDVTTNLGDRFEILNPLHPYLNSGVNLHDPSAAELDDATNAAILIALAKGYETGGLYAECVKITVAAERMLGDITPELAEVRTECQQQSGVTDLQAGGSP